MRRLRWWLSLTASAFIATNAYAQSSPSEATLAEAERRYIIAAEAMKNGNYTEACPRFDAVQKLIPNHLPTAITVARCYARAGQFLTAHDRYERAQIVAANQATQDKEMLKLITEGLASSSERISFLKVYVLGSVGSVDGVSVTLDGKKLESSDWGSHIPLNQGDHTIGATAPGRLPLTKKVEIKVEGKTSEVILDKLEIDPTAPTPQKAITPPPPRPPRTVKSSTIESKQHKIITTDPPIPTPKVTSSYVGGGIVLMLVGGGLITGGAILAKQADSQMPLYVGLSVIGFVAGTASFITGLAFATASYSQPVIDTRPKKPAPTVSLRFGPGQVFIQGKF